MKKTTKHSTNIIQECSLELKTASIKCACICAENPSIYAAGDSNSGVNIWTYGERFPFRVQCSRRNA